MQRLYSTFARGWPGAGLVWLRLIAGAASFHYGVTGRFAGPRISGTIIGPVLGLLLGAGLWTPIAGSILAVVAAWSAVCPAGDAWAEILLSGVGGALAMLGPGAWSIDSRLFGRKRLIHDSRAPSRIPSKE